MKTWFSYSLFTLFILLASFALTTSLFKAGFDKKLAESHYALLKQVQLYTDENIANSTTSLINSNFIDYNSHTPLLDFLDQALPMDTQTVLDAYETLFELLQTHDTIDSICLYRTADSVFVSTDEGICYDSTSEYSKVIRSPYPQLLERISSIPQKSLMLTMNQTYDGDNERKVLTFSKSIPLNSDFVHAGGYVLINIDQEKLFRLIRDVYGDDGTVFIVDKSGEVIANNTENDWLSDQVHRETLLKYIQDTGLASTSMKNGRNTYAVTKIFSQTGNWVYVSVMPISLMNQSMAEIVTLIMVLFLVVLAVGLLVITFITSRLHRPLRQLTLEASLHTDLVQEGQDDFSFMKDVFSYLSSQVGEMEQTIKDNSTIIEYKALVDLLYSKHGPVGGETDSYFSSRFTGGYCQLLMLEIRPAMYEKLDQNQRQFIHIKAKERMDRFLREKKIPFSSIGHPDHCVVAVINFDVPELSKSIMQDFLLSMEQTLGISANLAFSSFSVGLSGVPELFEQAQNFLRYRYLFGYHNTFTCEQILPYESGVLSGSPYCEEKLIGFLSGFDMEGVNKYLKELFTALYHGGFSYAQLQDICLHITGTVSVFYHKFKIELPDSQKERLHSLFCQIETMEQHFNWIYQTILAYNERHKLASDSESKRYIQGIADYISANVDRDISLSLVAERFNVSPSHLSRLFKEYFHTNFQNFLFDKKLDKAASLLLSEPNRAIADIALELGYFTPAYFSKIFKERFGVTPSRYRKTQGTMK